PPKTADQDASVPVLCHISAKMSSYLTVLALSSPSSLGAEATGSMCSCGLTRWPEGHRLTRKGPPNRTAPCTWLSPLQGGDTKAWQLAAWPELRGACAVSDIPLSQPSPLKGRGLYPSSSCSSFFARPGLRLRLQSLNSSLCVPARTNTTAPPFPA